MGVSVQRTKRYSGVQSTERIVQPEVQRKQLTTSPRAEYPGWRADQLKLEGDKGELPHQIDSRRWVTITRGAAMSCHQLARTVEKADAGRSHNRLGWDDSLAAITATSQNRLSLVSKEYAFR